MGLISSSLGSLRSPIPACHHSLVHGSESHRSTPLAGASPPRQRQGNPSSRQPTRSEPNNVLSRTGHATPHGGIPSLSLSGWTPASLNASPEAGPQGGHARRGPRDSSHTSSSRPLLLQVVPVARRTPQHPGLESHRRVAPQAGQPLAFDPHEALHRAGEPPTS